MEYKVFLADDEPGALRFLSHVIASRCPGWRVVGTAENGQRALAGMQACSPELLITDIRMPVMDGLSLAKQVRERWPDMRTVLISGYEDFEAAKSAIRCGVTDYLLKPVDPSGFIDMMERARTALLERSLREAAELIGLAAAGEEVRDERLERCFPKDRFSAAIIRKGTLPSRYSMSLSAPHPPERISPEKDCWMLSGRDEWERLIIQAEGSCLEANAHAVAARLPGKSYTVILKKEAFPLRQAYDVVTKLLRQAEKNHVLGYDQVIQNPAQASVPATVTPEVERKISEMCTGCFRTRELRDFLDAVFESWRESCLPLYYVRRDLERFLGAVERGLGGSRIIPPDFDAQLEDAMRFSASMEELRANIWNLILAALSHAESEDTAPGSKAFFDRVRGYLEQNLASQVTLQTLCSAMGISQTYMSRIFRRNTGVSFGEYLTRRRILRAKELMREKPELSLKTVAEMTGFRDPNYFSKVFRAEEGIPPSRFLTTIVINTE